MKSAVELNGLILKSVLLYQVGIQESSRKSNAKFNFLDITWESERSWRVHFPRFQRVQNPKFLQLWCQLQNILGLLQTPPILSYFEVGTYAPFLCFSDLLVLFYYTQTANTYIGIF